MTQPHLTLRTGAQFPAFGLGTWQSKPNEVYQAVRVALEAGYIHLDCAAVYHNEDEVGRAIKDAFKAGDITRDNLWVTSKLWNDSHARDAVKPALQKTLNDLQLEYVDLYLIHWPIAFKAGVSSPRKPSDFATLDEMPLQGTWEGMLEARDSGLARHVGVSNMGPVRMELLSKVGEKPQVNQVESHPFLQQKQVFEYCTAHDIKLTAYSPLGSPGGRDANEPSLLKHPRVVEIAEKHGAGPGQVLIAWAILRGTAVIPKSVTESRIRSNMLAMDLKLDDTDMAAIGELNQNHRFVDGTFFAGEGSPYTAEGIWL